LRAPRMCSPSHQGTRRLPGLPHSLPLTARPSQLRTFPLAWTQPTAPLIMQGLRAKTRAAPPCSSASQHTWRCCCFAPRWAARLDSIPSWNWNSICVKKRKCPPPRAGPGPRRRRRRGAGRVPRALGRRRPGALALRGVPGGAPARPQARRPHARADVRPESATWVWLCQASMARARARCPCGQGGCASLASCLTPGA